METSKHYQLAALRIIVREVIAQGAEPSESKRLVEWKLRILSQGLARSRCYTQAMWIRLLAAEVALAADVNTVWKALKTAESAKPPTSNRGVNSGAETVKGLSDG